jgi:branched-chain amino acid transport system permease protein
MIDYILTLTCLSVVGIILALSLNLVQGYGGIVTVSHGAFMGIGGYMTGVLLTSFGIDAAIGLVIGFVLSGVVGWLFMVVAARLDPDDFILASFALQMVVVDLFIQWSPVTGGSIGMFGIERPALFGFSLDGLVPFTIFCVVLGLLSWLVFAHISRSNYGLILRGIRESGRSVEAAGKNVRRTQVVSFAVGSAFAGLAGGLYATTIGLITPSDFSIHRSILVIACLLVGGIGNMTGAVVGTILLLALPEVVKTFAEVPTQFQGPGEQIIYGIIIVLFVWFRPQGLIPEKPVLKVRDAVRRRVEAAKAATAGAEANGTTSAGAPAARGGES